MAVLPIVGLLTHREDAFSGGTSTEAVGRLLDGLLLDASVKGIVFDIDSPGGELAGVPELAEKIYAARGRKPVTAVANSLMASAAYWIGAAADWLAVTPSGQAGGVGVVAVHVDRSGADRRLGVRYSLVSSHANKTELSQHLRLTTAAKRELERKVDRWATAFDEALARYRNVPLGIVQTLFGRGRIYEAPEALRRGMVDEVATLQDVFTRMVDGRLPASLDAARGRRRLAAAKLDELRREFKEKYKKGTKR